MDRGGPVRTWLLLGITVWLLAVSESRVLVERAVRGKDKLPCVRKGIEPNAAIDSAAGRAGRIAGENGTGLERVAPGGPDPQHHSSPPV